MKGTLEEAGGEGVLERRRGHWKGGEGNIGKEVKGTLERKERYMYV